MNRSKLVLTQPKLVLTITALLALSGCGRNLKESFDSRNQSASSSYEESVESGITTLGGVSDEENGSSYAAFYTPSLQKPIDVITELILPKAYAAACMRARAQACVNGVRTITYADCIFGLRNYSMSGIVTLSYSNSTCQVASTGEWVKREMDLNITGPRDGKLKITSAVEADYQGNQYGGGGKITKTSSGWQLEVLGKHKHATFRDKALFDVSVRTQAPINVTGTLGRAGRVMDGGSFEVNHNLRKFTAVYSPHNLTWNSNCCHPVSGSLDVVFSGSVTGSATVTFNGCGTASMVKEGLSHALNLTYCE